MIHKSLKIENNGYGLYIENLDEPTRFLEYISRISRYHEFYIKKFLAEFPINSRLEFLFLKSVNDLKHSKKTDLINIHLVDYSTGMDTIKRLINNDLLKETQKENDKRVKLLQITMKGKEVLSLAMRKLNDEKKMFLACISINKWKKTMPVLEEINNFHFLIFIKHYDKSSSELLNLMDSLKYLYK